MDPQKTSEDRSLSTAQRNLRRNARPQGRDEAAQLMRQQIDKLYDDQNSAQPHKDTQTNPYHRTHSETTAHQATTIHPEHWKQYHTQWQSYYQQYYERYYMHQLKKREQQLSGQAQPQPAAAPAMITAGEPEPDTLSSDQAIGEIRDKLLSKVKEQSTKVRSSRHFMPVALALTVALVFGILQYNSLIVAQVKAYVSPGSIDPANLIVDPTVDTHVGPDPKIVIPKINVDAPVVYDVPSIQESVVQDKLKSGVVHYPIPGANSLPGQKGNTVILGHSSNDVFDDGAYKFVFVQLDKLEKGDTFYLNYQGTRYTYSVTDKKIINPNEVNTLVLPQDKAVATLVTCTPPGTALKRLVVFAEQISPDPDKATAGAAQSTDKPVTPIAGNSPTLFERLFGF